MVQTRKQPQKPSLQAVTDSHVQVRRHDFRNLFKRNSTMTRPLPVIGLASWGAQFVSRKQRPVGQRLKLYFDIPALTENLEVGAVISGCEEIPDKNAYKIEVTFWLLSRKKEQLIKSVVNDPLLCGMKSGSGAA